MNNEIKALKVRVLELEQQLQAAKSVLHGAQCEAIGIQNGDVVTDRRGLEFKVSRIEIWDFSTSGDRPGACLYGFKRGVSGEFTKRDQYIGTEWSKVSIGEATSQESDRG